MAGRAAVHSVVTLQVWWNDTPKSSSLSITKAENDRPGKARRSFASHITAFSALSVFDHQFILVCWTTLIGYRHSAGRDGVNGSAKGGKGAVVQSLDAIVNAQCAAASRIAILDEPPSGREIYIDTIKRPGPAAVRMEFLLDKRALGPSIESFAGHKTPNLVRRWCYQQPRRRPLHSCRLGRQSGWRALSGKETQNEKHS